MQHEDLSPIRLDYLVGVFKHHRVLFKGFFGSEFHQSFLFYHTIMNLDLKLHLGIISLWLRERGSFLIHVRQVGALAARYYHVCFDLLFEDDPPRRNILYRVTPLLLVDDHEARTERSEMAETLHGDFDIFRLKSIRLADYSKFFLVRVAAWVTFFVRLKVSHLF